jgi:hypothetical protein
LESLAELEAAGGGSQDPANIGCFAVAPSVASTPSACSNLYPVKVEGYEETHISLVSEANLNIHYFHGLTKL